MGKNKSMEDALKKRFKGKYYASNTNDQIGPRELFVVTSVVSDLDYNTLKLIMAKVKVKQIINSNRGELNFSKLVPSKELYVIGALRLQNTYREVTDTNDKFNIAKFMIAKSEEA